MVGPTFLSGQIRDISAPPIKGKMYEEIIARLQEEVNDPNNELLSAGAYAQFVADGARFYSRVRPRKRRAFFTLVADQAEYDELPDDFMELLEVEWGSSARQLGVVAPQPWDDDYSPPVPLPLFRISDEKIYLDPAPTVAQLAAFGATFAYWYSAAHTLTEETEETEEVCTIPEFDASIVMLFAQWSMAIALAKRSDQAEDFVVRYRKTCEQLESRIEKLTSVTPAIIRS